MILLIVLIYAGTLYTIASLPEPQKELMMQLVEVTDKGYYFHEPTAEFEDIILVELKDAKAWNLTELNVGASVIGLFDSTGWTLEGVKQ